MICFAGVRESDSIGRIAGADDVLRWAVKRRLHRAVQEELWVLFVDSMGTIRGSEMVGKGSESGVNVSAGCVLRAVLLSGCWRCLLVHNHPSGRVVASAEDVAFTRGVRDGAAFLGIDVLDHVIVGSRMDGRRLVGDCYSVRSGAW